MGEGAYGRTRVWHCIPLTAVGTYGQQQTALLRVALSDHNEVPMALWKETTDKAQDTGPAQAQSVPATPVTAISVAPRGETRPKERHESFFGPGVTIDGTIEGDASVRIGGKFTGDIKITGNLNIDKGARIVATVNADTVTIQGELEGNIFANGQVTLLESSQVIGDIKAATLTVAAGSRMRGNVEFGWSKAENERIATIRADRD